MMPSTRELPPEIVVNPAEKTVIITPEVAQVFPDATEAFQKVDEAFSRDPESYLNRLEESLFSFRSSTGAEIDCSLIPGSSDEILVMWAPFSDSAPRSSAKEIYHYISGEKINKAKAAPNSWNQTTKSGVVAELLKATGKDMPVLTIYSPLPSVPHNAYTREEYKRIRRGDFSPSGRIVQEALEHAQDRLHGKKSETQLDEVHVHGASLGASTAIGTAYSFAKAVRTVTAQELIVAPKTVFPDLAARFTVRGTAGEASEREVDESLPKIPEPLLRQKIDSNGNELMMVGRMLQGMSKVSRLKGLTRPERNVTPYHIEHLAKQGTSVLLPLAEQSGLTHDTPNYLPQAGEQVLPVRATKGERTTHLIDEHVALTALIAVMHINKTRND